MFSGSPNIFPHFYGTRLFIILFTKARQTSLPWIASVRSLTSHPISLRTFLLLPFLRRIDQVDSVLHISPLKAFMYFLSPHTCNMPRPSHFPLFSHPNCILTACFHILLTIFKLHNCTLNYFSHSNLNKIFIWISVLKCTKDLYTIVKRRDVQSALKRQICYWKCYSVFIRRTYT